jgi:hypothetical protein
MYILEEKTSRAQYQKLQQLFKSENENVECMYICVSNNAVPA